MLDFEIAVYAANEAPQLGACVLSVDRACAGSRGGITVILNGTNDNSLEVLSSLRLQHASLRVFRLPFGDKAYAINTFLYDLRRPAATYVQVDGYARISVGSLKAMRDAFSLSSEINIVSSLQTTGRSAEMENLRTLAGGKCTGQFHALRPSFADRIVGENLRLPLRLYSGDGLLGSMAAHDLDPLRNAWDDRRVVGISGAKFQITPLTIWRWRDIQRQYKREIRQSLGRLQNKAIQAIIRKGGYAALPVDGYDMVRDWLAVNQHQPQSLWERYKLRCVVKQLGVPPVSPCQAELILER